MAKFSSKEINVVYDYYCKQQNGKKMINASSSVCLLLATVLTTTFTNPLHGQKLFVICSLFQALSLLRRAANKRRSDKWKERL